MQWKLLINDFRKKAWKNIVLFIFMCLSVIIAVTVVLMLCQLFSSITAMYAKASPPHFLQMHTGSVEQADLDAFNQSYQGVTGWQTTAMINLNGDEISVRNAQDGYTLADCRLDIGFVKQNEIYDVLLDEKREVLQLKLGEVGVPVILLDQYEIHKGDQLILCADGMEKEFTVADFVYDGMMNSTMCSSTRFLLSDEDFDALLGNVGETEYLIETYFTDSSMASAYQAAYEQSELHLPKDGQAITYKMIFLISALTDILTAIIFVLAGAMLIMIVVLCLRYVILAELEEDVREIGTMKSIGIPERGIENLYLSKIRILSGAACIVGFALAVLLLPAFTQHISRFFGSQGLKLTAILLAIVAAVAIYGIILFFTRRILKKIKKKTIVDLMVREEGFSKKKIVRSRMYRAGKLPVNVLVGMQEARHGYGIIFILMLLISFVILVPLRCLRTMQDKEFVTYMGSPVCDLLIEVPQGSGLEERNEMLQSILEKEAGKLQEVSELRRVRLQAMSASEEVIGVYVDTGASAGKGIVYVSGSAPAKEDEIALSYLLAQELGLNAGDQVSISSEQKTYELRVCGIYQDVTSGGRTAKAIYDFQGEASSKYTYQVRLREGAFADAFATDLKARLGGGYSLKSMEGFLDQTLGGVTTRLGEAVWFVIGTGFVITALIVVLFMELRLARMSGALAQKIAIGIPLSGIFMQELYPVLIHGGLGVLLGMICTELFGEGIVSGLFSMLGLGIKGITFSGMTMECILIAISLVALLALIDLGVCRKIKRIDVTEYFNQ